MLDACWLGCGFNYFLCGSRPSPTFPKKLDMAPARCNKCKDLETEIAALKDQLAKVTEQLGKLQQQNLDSKIQAAVGEQFEKERCRKSLLISGVEETEDSDTAKVEEILAEVGVDKEQICGIYRMGDPPEKVEINNDAEADDDSPPGKPRLLKVKLWSGHWRNEALRNAKNLKGQEQYKGIYVNPSRTFLERQKIKELWQKLMEKKANGQENWMIDYKNFNLKPMIQQRQQKSRGGQFPGRGGRGGGRGGGRS